ncbi:hypothetical protein ACH5RR_016014 [Cinchona calisaya]|uniref:Uncharacterized protein n=1 Tax=Cinchona calisaya TaxID=153742 RepID=A0ABD2ZXU7_9GENT
MSPRLDILERPFAALLSQSMPGSQSKVLVLHVDSDTTRYKIMISFEPDETKLSNKALAYNEKAVLGATPTAFEIKNACFSFKPVKTPSPDEFHFFFMQKFWNHISSSVTHFVDQAFSDENSWEPDATWAKVITSRYFVKDNDNLDQPVKSVAAVAILVADFSIPEVMASGICSAAILLIIGNAVFLVCHGPLEDAEYIVRFSPKASFQVSTALILSNLVFLIGTTLASILPQDKKCLGTNQFTVDDKVAPTLRQ